MECIAMKFSKQRIMWEEVENLTLIPIWQGAALAMAHASHLKILYILKKSERLMMCSSSVKFAHSAMQDSNFSSFSDEYTFWKFFIHFFSF